jgi:acetoacetyl-CoA synthetase
MDQPKWIPSELKIKNSEMTKYTLFLKEKLQIELNHYVDLHRFSVENSSLFWNSLFPYFNISYSGALEPAFTNLCFDQYTWYPNVEINFAENLLKNGKDKNIAFNFVHESGLQKKMTYLDLRSDVAKLSKTLSEFIKNGDVVSAYMPNLPETAIAMLATSSLGGIFTSTSSDFGIDGVVDRFSQSRPKVLIAAIGYEYGGKYFDQTSKIIEIEKRLPSIEKIILVDFLERGIDLSQFNKSIKYCDIVNSTFIPQLNFVKNKFSHPLYIMYSSGTTGKPKCIVHSQGGVLLQHLKELSLHSNLNESKKISFFTTCGWMMWNWLISSLYFGSEIILYEGSPAHPSPESFFKIINREKINIFGTSPRFLKALEDSNAHFEDGFESLETLLSTGSPLLPEQYDYVYNRLKKDIHLSSISGGTDIIGCFMLGNPNLPVFAGEIQCKGLGMDIQALDDNGRPVTDLEGELVCRKSFPSRPIYFLDDQNNEKIKAAYFNQNPGVWTHGDFIKINHRGGVIVYGRSDATLNPGGVRIGTAEIYRQTEQLSFIVDSICVGRSSNGDVDVVLFVKMQLGLTLSSEHKKAIKDIIRKNTTPRHVPKEIFQVVDIPYTRSGKKVELAITKILANKEVTNVEALSNPECLSEYKNFIF